MAIRQVESLMQGFTQPNIEQIRLQVAQTPFENLRAQRAGLQKFDNLVWRVGQTACLIGMAAYGMHLIEGNIAGSMADLFLLIGMTGARVRFEKFLTAHQTAINNRLKYL